MSSPRRSLRCFRTTYFNALKKFWGATTGQTFGWVAPKGALGQEAMFQMVSINRGDAKAMMESQQEMMNSQQALTEMFAVERPA